jgi:hypothetical protein
MNHPPIVNKHLIILALASCTSLWAIPSYAEQQSQISFTGQVLPQCSFSMVNNSPTSGNIASFALLANRGSMTTVCNTSSTLSVSIDRDASSISNLDPKIRFAAGGTGIYTQAHQGSNYQEIATFSSQEVTSAIGDTAEVEVNLPDASPNSIVVYASLTPQ